jgi:hypothetical protein
VLKLELMEIHTASKVISVEVACMFFYSQFLHQDRHTEGSSQNKDTKDTI